MIIGKIRCLVADTFEVEHGGVWQQNTIVRSALNEDPEVGNLTLKQKYSKL